MWFASALANRAALWGQRGEPAPAHAACKAFRRFVCRSPFVPGLAGGMLSSRPQFKVVCLFSWLSSVSLAIVCLAAPSISFTIKDMIGPVRHTVDNCRVVPNNARELVILKTLAHARSNVITTWQVMRFRKKLPMVLSISHFFFFQLISQFKKEHIRKITENICNNFPTFYWIPHFPKGAKCKHSHMWPP